MNQIVILIVIVALIMSVNLFFGKRKLEKKKVAYQKLADELGLTLQIRRGFLSSSVELTGTLFNHPVRIYEEKVSDGDDGYNIYTHLTFANSPFAFGFKIRKERFLNKIGKKLGFNDIEFGDKELDAMYNFKAHHEVFFREIMTMEIQKKIMDVRGVFNGTLHNSKGKLDYSSEMELTNQPAVRELKLIMGFMEDLLKVETGFSVHSAKGEMGSSGRAGRNSYR